MALDNHKDSEEPESAEFPQNIFFTAAAVVMPKDEVWLDDNIATDVANRKIHVSAQHMSPSTENLHVRILDFTPPFIANREDTAETAESLIVVKSESALNAADKLKNAFNFNTTMVDDLFDNQNYVTAPKNRRLLTDEKLPSICDMNAAKPASNHNHIKVLDNGVLEQNPGEYSHIAKDFQSCLNLSTVLFHAYIKEHFEEHDQITLRIERRKKKNRGYSKAARLKKKSLKMMSGLH